MEQSSAQNAMPGLPHAGTSQGSLPPEYWNNLDSIYPDAQLQPSQPQQPQDLSSQQPLGIGWDHPVFQQQTQPAQQQRSHLASQTEQNHGIYSIPQSWQPNPLQQPNRGYSISPQYQTHQQVHQYLDSRPLTASESSAFPSYTFQPNYYHQQVSLQDSFPEQRSTQQHPQSADFQAGGPPSAISQFALPSGYPPELLHNTIDLTNDFTSDPRNHQTIDPQFLNNGAPSTNQQQTLQNNFLYTNPADFERGGGRVFDFYQNDLSVQPHLGSAPNATVHSNGMYFLNDN